MSVNILGIGAMGMLLAHEYAAVSTLKPVLLAKHKNIFKIIQSLQYSMTVAHHGQSEVAYNTVRMETRQSPLVERWDTEQKITDMVVATKTYSTLEALEPYLQYITPETNMLFLQNGMGVVPAVREKLWQPRQEPNIYHILSSHGAYKERINLTRHVGLGTLTISKVPLRDTNRNSILPNLAVEEPAPFPEVIDALFRSPILGATYEESFQAFQVAQMEKLAINACINPLTALLDCLNGDLLRSSYAVSMVRKVLQECSACFAKETTDYDAVPEASTVLSPDRLFARVVQVCQVTAMNSSSMREDIRNLKMTEIDSINGYIVKLGVQYGVPTPLNRSLCSMIRSKHEIERSKEHDFMAKDKLEAQR